MTTQSYGNKIIEGQTMTINLGELKRKRRQPDARKIKKHSDFADRTANKLIVGGTRERTDTGFVVPGYRGKTFETYYETMLAGTSTSTYRHEKKDRTIRVLSGVLFVLASNGGEDTERRAIAGDEIAIDRGTSFRLATSIEPVSMFVCQSAKYAATLELVTDSTLNSKPIPENLLQEPTLGQRISQIDPSQAPTLRKGSKAKEQLVAMHAGRKGGATTIDEPIPGRVGDVSASHGVSPRPSGGKFSEEGAG
jgi:mannose-6-phosphate isomerase-like protein (cupin superfamily)